MSPPAGGAARDTQRAVYAALPRKAELGLEAWRALDQRLPFVEGIAEIVGLIDPGALIVLPAGFFAAPSVAAAEVQAATLLRVARRHLVALAFGIDVDSPWDDRDVGEPLDSWAFAGDGGPHESWSARRVRPTRREGQAPVPPEPRCMVLGGRRVGLVLGSEVFHVGLRRALARMSPDLIVVLTHVGASPRWEAALEALREVAPVLVTGELPPEVPPRPGARRRGRTVPSWLEPPAGWSRAAIGSHGDLELYCFGPLVRSMGAEGKASEPLARAVGRA